MLQACAAQVEGLTAALQQVEGPLVRVLASMEAAGLAIQRCIVRAHKVRHHCPVAQEAYFRKCTMAALFTCALLL